jgi:hypothetical protein
MSCLMRLDLFVAVFVSTHVSPFGKPRRCSAISTRPDLKPQQLRRAASIIERIDRFNRELRTLLDRSVTSGPTSKRKKRTMSAAVRKKIAAAQKARWAKIRRA